MAGQLATGDWRLAIAPQDYMPTGVIESPTGERSWPMSLDGVGPGDAVLTLPSITCGDETFEVELRITALQ
jgi:hypothetical protein